MDIAILSIEQSRPLHILEIREENLEKCDPPRLQVSALAMTNLVMGG
jgi:hypothetical protein